MTAREAEERDLPWEQSPECRRLVAAHPDGMSLQEIADYYGVSRQAVWKIEEKALQTLMCRCGAWAAAVVAELALRPGSIWPDICARDEDMLGERDAIRAYRRVRELYRGSRT